MTGGAEPGGDGQNPANGWPPYKRHELRIAVTDDDRPEDKFSHHVNNARYFAFINRTFQGWYRAMGLRGQLPDQSAVMAHLSYDFLHQVLVPGEVLCRINTVRAGTKSLEHEIQMWDLHPPAPALAGRGTAVHVFLQRSSATTLPWPREVLDLCWNGEAHLLPADRLDPGAE
jgi:acyl-CoA thioesterase FadM